MLVRIWQGLAGEAVEQPGGALAVSRFAGGKTELHEARHQGGIGVGGGVVMGIAGAGDEMIGLVGGEGEAATLLVPMMLDERGGKGAGRGEMCGIGGGLVKGEAGVDEVGIAIGGGGMTPLPFPPGLKQPGAIPQTIEHAGQGACSSADPVRPVEQQAGIGECSDGKSVPVGQDLVVEAWRDPRSADGEKPVAQSGKAGLVGGIEQIQMTEPVENVVALEIAIGRHAVNLLEESGIRTERRVDLARRPQVILPLLALRIGVVARREGAACDRHRG